jgi:hypothetical protein
MPSWLGPGMARASNAGAGASAGGGDGCGNGRTACLPSVWLFTCGMKIKEK